jgi:hypothetical protein
MQVPPQRAPVLQRWRTIVVGCLLNQFGEETSCASAAPAVDDKAKAATAAMTKLRIGFLPSLGDTLSAIRRAAKLCVPLALSQCEPQWGRPDVDSADRRAFSQSEAHATGPELAVRTLNPSRSGLQRRTPVTGKPTVARPSEACGEHETTPIVTLRGLGPKRVRPRMTRPGALSHSKAASKGESRDATRTLARVSSSGEPHSLVARVARRCRLDERRPLRLAGAVLCGRGWGLINAQSDLDGLIHYAAHRRARTGGLSPSSA